MSDLFQVRITNKTTPFDDIHNQLCHDMPSLKAELAQIDSQLRHEYQAPLSGDSIMFAISHLRPDWVCLWNETANLRIYVKRLPFVPI